MKNRRVSFVGVWNLWPLFHPVATTIKENSPETMESSHLEWLDKVCLFKKTNEELYWRISQSGNPRSMRRIEVWAPVLVKTDLISADSSSRVQIKFENFQHQLASQLFTVLFSTLEIYLKSVHCPSPFYAETIPACSYIEIECRKAFWKVLKAMSIVGTRKPSVKHWTCGHAYPESCLKSDEVIKMTCSANWMCWPLT